MSWDPMKHLIGFVLGINSEEFVKHPMEPMKYSMTSGGTFYETCHGPRVGTHGHP